MKKKQRIKQLETRVKMLEQLSDVQDKCIKTLQEGICSLIDSNTRLYQKCDELDIRLQKEGK